jgi:hypothetical protein
MNIRTAHHRIANAVAGSAIVAGLALGLSAPASADVITASGSVGTSSVGNAGCEYFSDTDTTAFYTAPPSIFAFDATAGKGNDREYVRYQVLVFDAKANKEVFAGKFTEPVLATDTTAAAFPKHKAFTINGNSNFHVLYRVEWRGASNDDVYASTVHAVDKYNLYTPGSEDYKVSSVCNSKKA